MTRSPNSGWSGGARQLRILLPISFALTVASFVASTVISELEARGIAEAADSIATNAAPSIYNLARERSDLREMEGLMVEYAHQLATGRDAGILVPRIEEARRVLQEEWRREKAAPINYPGERELWVEIETASRDVDAAVGRLLAAPKLDPRAVERVLYDEVRPATNRMAEALLVDLELNARYAEELAATIATTRNQSRRVAFALDALSATLAAAAGLMLYRILHDYTAATEQRLSELEHFAGRVAHDIRSPLTAVGLALETTRRRPGIDEASGAMLERATRSLQRVGQVVDGLLVLARAGMQPAEGSHANLQAVAKGVIEELAPSAREQEVDLALERVMPFELACSPGALTSILSNLIGNAIKYMGDEPIKRVRVRARDLGSKVRVEVEDTGPGVRPELRERIFDPYTRAAASSIPGLGLGLATVRRLVEAHGGAVGIEAGEAGGSRFWVELPKANGRGAVQSAEERETSSKPPR